MKYEIDIFHYLAIYKKEWKRIFFLMAVAVSIAVAITHSQPVIYRSIVIALTSKATDRTVSFGGVMGLGDISLSKSSDYTIFCILTSRRMRDDINAHFNTSSMPVGFWWNLETYQVRGGFAVEVKGSDPEMTRDIANFAVKNVDEINQELHLSPSISLIKVLDSAIKGAPIGKERSKRIISSALSVFLIYVVFIFFKEYFSQLRRQRRK